MKRCTCAALMAGECVCGAWEDAEKEKCRKCKAEARALVEELLKEDEENYEGLSQEAIEKARKWLEETK